VDPTNRIFVSSKSGCLKVISIVKQEKQYVYLELDQREYLTLSVSKDKSRGRTSKATGSQKTYKREKDPDQMGQKR